MSLTKLEKEIVWRKFMNRRKIKIYIAGKYTGDVKKNIEIAARTAAKIWDLGFTALCPHANSSHFELICKKTKWMDFLEGDMELLKDCHAMYMLPDWENSVGAQKEYGEAQKRGLKIFHDLRVLDAFEWEYSYKKSIALEAYNIVNERSKKYGDPVISWCEIADMFYLRTGIKLSAEKCIILLECMKQIREKYGHNRDNLVDQIGYLEIKNKIIEAKDE